jgi:hypothetical protein
MNLNELRQDASATLRIPQHISLAPARARRTYIAGPMTGYPDFNHPAFNAAAAQLRAAGIAAINPADHGVVPGAVWEDYLRSDLAQLATCESIYFLPGWSKSRGALLEHHIATALGMRMLFADGAETPQTVRLRDELRERPEQHGLHTCHPLAFARLAIDHSHNFATAKPDIGETEKEHILGLCKVVESLVEALAATGKQQADEVQGDEHVPVLRALRAILNESGRSSPARTAALDAAIAALAARQPVGQEAAAHACTNCDRTDSQFICQTCAGSAWDNGRLHEFNETRELTTSLGEGALDHLLPDAWHQKPLLRFQGAYDEGDPSVGMPGSCGNVLAADQTGTVLGDYLAARAPKDGGK